MKIRLIASLSVALLLIAGCDEKKEVVQHTANGVSNLDGESNQTTEAEVAGIKLVEQGFEIGHLHTFKNEDVVFFELNREGHAYYAMMDSNYEWVLKPTNEIKGIQYDRSFSQTRYDLVIYEGEDAPIIQDRLIALAVQDDRPRKDDGLL